MRTMVAGRVDWAVKASPSPVARGAHRPSGQTQQDYALLRSHTNWRFIHPTHSPDFGGGPPDRPPRDRSQQWSEAADPSAPPGRGQHPCRTGENATLEVGATPFSDRAPERRIGRMNDRTASRPAWFVWGLSAVLGLAGCLLVWINSGATSIADADLVFSMFMAVAGVGYATVGALIASRRRNAVGWILLFIGAMFALVAFLIQYAARGLAGTGSLPAERYAAWTSTWGWIPSIGAIPLLLLLFPTGRL